MIPGIIAGRRTNASSGTPGGDPHWNNVVLLMAFDDTNNRLLDKTGRHTPVIVGTPTWEAGRFGQAYWTGNNLANRIEVPVSPDFDLGSGDFTIEFWHRRYGAQNNGGYISHYRSTGSNRSWGFWRNIADVRVFASLDGINNNIDMNTVWLDSENWQHFAFTRQGDTFRVFMSGVQRGSQTLSGAAIGAPLHRCTAPLDIGVWNNTHPARGPIDEIRITKGVCRYTTNFSQPASSFPAFS
jgi:hypothetical protein